MTPSTQRLNQASILEQNPLYLFRLARMKYASLSGQGAALSAGRWNHLGQEAIYTSLDPATTVLERLVHTPKDRIPNDLGLMRIKVSGNWTPTENWLMDVKTSGRLLAIASLDEAGKAFRVQAASIIAPQAFAIAIPSVIVPAWNVVLYPQELGFWDHVSLEGIEPFHYDPRLFPDDALPDPATP